MIIFDNLSISTIRSGKGDCIHLRFVGVSGNTHNIIIDSGPTSTAGEFRNLIRTILAKSEKLDCLIISHYDDDHIGGILKVGDHGFQDIYFNAYSEAEETENLSAIKNQRLFHSLPSTKVHRMAIVAEMRCVDQVVPQENMDKLEAVKKYGADCYP